MSRARISIVGIPREFRHFHHRRRLARGVDLDGFSFNSVRWITNETTRNKTSKRDTNAPRVLKCKKMRVASARREDAASRGTAERLIGETQRQSVSPSETPWRRV